MPAQPPTAGAAHPARLESLTVGAQVTGVDPRGPVRVIQAQWHGADCLDLTYRDATGRTDHYKMILPVQPLRFLLTDDPGAGKTIMTGLFIKELMLRRDLKRCMVVRADTRMRAQDSC